MILGKENSKDTGKNDTSSSNMKSSCEMLKVTTLPYYNLRGTEEVLVGTGSLNELGKTSKLGIDFSLNNLEDKSILNKGQKIVIRSKAPTNVNDLNEFQSAKSHTSSVISIEPKTSNRSENTNIISDSNTSCSSLKVPYFRCQKCYGNRHSRLDGTIP